MRIGRLILSVELLEQLLHMKEGNHIGRVTQDVKQSFQGTFELSIVGDDCPKIHKGEEIPIINP